VKVAIVYHSESSNTQQMAPHDKLALEGTEYVLARWEQLTAVCLEPAQNCPGRR